MQQRRVRTRVATTRHEETTLFVSYEIPRARRIESYNGQAGCESLADDLAESLGEAWKCENIRTGVPRRELGRSRYLTGERCEFGDSLQLNRFLKRGSVGSVSDENELKAGRVVRREPRDELRKGVDEELQILLVG